MLPLFECEKEVKYVECGSGDKQEEEELLLCDKCDRGYHMVCVKPIVVWPPAGNWYCPNYIDHPPKLKGRIPNKILYEFFKLEKWSSTSSTKISPQESRKGKRRTSTFSHHKKNRKLLSYVPSKDDVQRRKQMRTLYAALKSLNAEFSNDLTYLLVWLQNLLIKPVWRKVVCRYTVEADDPIKDMTLIAEYVGNVDFINNRTHDGSDSMMTLLLAEDPSKSLVTCGDKRGNISRFFSGRNNHIRELKKKRNVKCVRYNVNGACRNLLVATRDIARGQKLYFDYNGLEHAYPTQNFV